MKLKRNTQRHYKHKSKILSGRNACPSKQIRITITTNILLSAMRIYAIYIIYHFAFLKMQAFLYSLPDMSYTGVVAASPLSRKQGIPHNLGGDLADTTGRGN